MQIEHYVRVVADALKAAEGEGYVIDDVAKAAVEIAKRERRDAAARKLYAQKGKR
jgi:hypothetical protein